MPDRGNAGRLSFQNPRPAADDARAATAADRAAEHSAEGAARRMRAIAAGSWLRRTSVGVKLTALTLMFVGVIVATIGVWTLSLKVSNGVRAYIAGEGHWSRAQKDATFALERYADHERDEDFLAYERALEVTLGDRRARLELEKPAYDYGTVAAGFVQGNNNALDVPDLIFLFRYFRRVSYLEQAIGIWTEADATIDRMRELANRLRLALRATPRDAAAIDRLRAELDVVTAHLTMLELRFSSTLAAGARWVHATLLGVGMTLSALLLIGGVLFARRVAAQLREGIGALQEGTARVAAGELYTEIELRSQDELGELATAFNGMTGTLRASALALDRRLQFETLVMRLSSAMTKLKPTQVDEGINRALADIGRFAQVDRSYVFLFDDTHTTVTCTHEWCAPGIEPQIGRLQGVRVADYAWVEEQLERGEVVHVPRVSALPPEAATCRAEWEAESIRSILLVPVRTGEAVRGYVGFDSVRTERSLPEESHNVLRIFGEIVLNTLTRVTAELSLRERNAKLAATVEELERSNAELEQFAYVASHDLRTPLRGIAGFIQLLRRRAGAKLDAGAQEYIDLALHSVDQMQSFIEGLLELSRIGKGAMAPETTDCELALRQVLAQLAPLIDERGARVTHDPLPRVTAIPIEIHQLLQNLITNAIKFQPGLRPRVHVSVVREGDDWKFGVRDYGIGIKPEHRDRIFQLFQRLHGRDQYDGSGIGLAVCRKIVQRLGGRIWVESEEGKGSTFFFTLRAMGSELGSGTGVGVGVEVGTGVGTGVGTRVAL